RRLRLPPRTTFRVLQVNPLENQTEFSGFERLHYRAVRSGNSVTSLLETLRPHGNAVAIPIHDAHTVHASREENEEVATEDIYSETLAHQDQQTIGPLTPIDCLRGHKQLYTWRQTQHQRCLVNAQTSSTASGTSADSHTRTTTPSGKTTSTACFEWDLSGTSTKVSATGFSSRCFQRYRRCTCTPCCFANLCSDRPDVFQRSKSFCA